MTFFGKKCPFQRRKFFMTFFLVIDRIFMFCLSLLSEIWQITYMALFFTKNLYFRQKIPSWHFHTHPITLLLEILGRRMHGPSPTSNFGGTVSPSPSKSPPMVEELLEDHVIRKLLHLDPSTRVHHRCHTRVKGWRTSRISHCSTIAIAIIIDGHGIVKQEGQW